MGRSIAKDLFNRNGLSRWLMPIPCQHQATDDNDRRGLRRVRRCCFGERSIPELLRQFFAVAIPDWYPALNAEICAAMLTDRGCRISSRRVRPGFRIGILFPPEVDRLQAASSGEACTGRSWASPPASCG